MKKSPKREVLKDLRELEEMIREIPEKDGNTNFQAELYDIIEELQEFCSKISNDQLVRELIAQFGDAYFYYRQTGDFSNLSDFLKKAKIAEQKIR